ncbi:hypothetical protein GM1_007_00140 [Gordonia malaquae NBRC 108250]|uniref:Uncharacterized protein n=1 Tax=Gordonia malaquae NBRC 108250 TaxID=1223542 RepID=M3UI23_GORML|nr:hypothetical protein GM1_007_00140 [Gordonia malaquae NBRC 108250]
MCATTSLSLNCSILTPRKGSIMGNIPDISGINDLMKTLNALLNQAGSNENGGSQTPSA